MTRYLRAGFGLPLALAALLVLGAPAAELLGQDGEDDMLSTLAGVYTDEQAERGQDLMWDICAECHFEDDFQGPFIQDWAGATVWGLFDSIWSTMPEDNPGGLPLTDYADAIAYMFRLNGLPAGEDELGTEKDVLDKITIEWEP